MKPILNTLLILTLSAGALFAQSQKEHSAVNEVLLNFKQAIIENDKQVVQDLMHKDALILEGTGLETKEEYLSHHFKSDGDFLRNLDEQELKKSVNINGNTAWISTVSNLKGTYSDREIDIISLELAVLNKVKDGWKIMAIHWSSK